MSSKKTRIINLYITPGGFSSFFKRFKGEKKDYDFSGLKDLRQLLNAEKARIIHTIKEKNPESIYALAKLLKRDFRAVRQDVRILEQFGFIETKSGSSGKRKTLKPVLIADAITINLNL